MSFFGSDGLEHQVKHLKQQSANKDIEITSLRNELRKKDEELLESKRQREGTTYKEEEERAHKAETALKQRTQELTNLRLQHDNLQSSLIQAKDKIRAGEKENKGLQYDVESLGFTQDDAKSLQQERDSLQAELKDLKRKLCRIEEEKAESAIPVSRHQLRKSPTTDFFGQSVSPPKRGNRRRSTSLSSDNRVSELEAEIEMLRSTHGPSSIELDKIKAQLSTARKELDKATNAKLAFERSSEREKSELKSRLDDAEFELEDWRRNDGGASKIEIEKVKKAAKVELDNAAAKVRELEKEVEEKGRTVERLERELSGMDDLRTELDEARSAQSLTISRPSADLSGLQAKLASLEEELAQARSVPSSAAGSAGAIADKTIRQLKREVKTLSATITSLEEEVASQDEEISRLRTAVPLPGSPVLAPSTSDADLTRITELEEDLEEARAEVPDLKEKLEVTEETKHALQKQLADVTVQQAEAEAALKSAQEELNSSRARISELEAEVQGSKSTSDDHQQEVDTARQAAAQAQFSLAEVQTRLDDLVQQHTEVSSQLASRSHDDKEVSAIMARVQEKERVVTELEAAVQAAQVNAVEVEASVAEAMSERDASKAAVQSLHEDVLSLRDRLVDAEDRLRAAATEKKTAMKTAKEKHREAIAESESLRLQLGDAQAALVAVQQRADEMQERFEQTLKNHLDIENTLNDLRGEYANRSTDSEARQRDEELVNEKEAAQKLREAFEVKQAEHAREVDAAALTYAKNLEESQGRVAQLENDLACALSSATNLKLAEDKIHRLRAERDELRISLHFVNHEQRFTSKEVEDHRVALQSARVDFSKQNTLLSNLQQQHDETAERSGEMSAKLKDDLHEATIACDTLSSRINELEIELEARLADCREQEAQAGALASDWTIAKSQADRYQAEVAELRRANRDLKVHYDRTRATLEAKLDTDARREAEDNTSTAERSAPAEDRRVRRISGLSFASSSPASDQLEKLKVSHAETMGRLKRRDATIREIQNQLKQKETNLRLADEALTENFTRAEQLEKELDTVTAEAAGLRKELLVIEGNLRQAESDSRAHSRSLEQVIIALAAEHHSARQNARLWAKRVEILGESDNAVDRVTTMASATIEQAKSQIVSLSAQAAASEARAVETHNELSKARSIEVGLQEQLKQVESASRSTESALQRELDGLRSSFHETAAKLAEVEQVNAKLEPLADQVNGLQANLAASTEEISMRQADIANLLDKLAQAEKSRGTSQEEAAASALTMAELKQARDQVTSLKGEHETLLAELEDLQRMQDEMATQHQDTVTAVTAKHSSEIAQLKSALDSLHVEIENKIAEIDAAKGNATDLTAQLYAQSEKISALEAKSTEDQSTIDSLRHQIGQLEHATSQLSEFTATIAENQITIDHLQAKISELETSTNSLREERDNLSGRVNSLETDLSAAGQGEQVQIAQMRTRILDLESSGAALETERNDLSNQLKHLTDAASTTNRNADALHMAVEAAKSRESVLERELSEAMTSLQTVQQGAVDAQRTSSVLQEEAIALREENAGLAKQLDQAKNATPPASATGNAEELQERVTELEASLTLKVQEVDEADDRVREAYKEKSKLEKKVAKLQRQLLASSKDAETAANTAANKNITLAPVSVSMAPPPIAALRQAPTSSTPRSAAVAASPRQPLRAVNVFEPKPSPSVGIKRAREEKLDEKPLPAECILLPPAQLDGARAFKTAPRTVFTGFRPKPQGGNVFEAQNTTPRINVFSENYVRNA